MSLLAALVTGALIGMRHAVETDHVAAVTALVERGADRPGLVGASWGVGHSIPVAAVGLAFLFLGVELPPLLFSVVEGVVGVVLVVLGLRLLLGGDGWLRHAHDDSTDDDGGDGDHDDHDHVGIGSLLVGVSHSHQSTHSHEHHHETDDGTASLAHSHAHVHGVDGDDGHDHPDQGLVGLDTDDHDHDHDESETPLSLDTGGAAVGAIHGLAGSGALVVALVATAPSFDNAVAFLGGFSVLSVLTMGAVSAVWARALETRGHELLTVVAGVVGVAAGLLLLAEVAGVASLFTL